MTILLWISRNLTFLHLLNRNWAFSKQCVAFGVKKSTDIWRTIVYTNRQTVYRLCQVIQVFSDYRVLFKSIYAQFPFGKIWRTLSIPHALLNCTSRWLKHTVSCWNQLQKWKNMWKLPEKSNWKLMPKKRNNVKELAVTYWRHLTILSNCGSFVGSHVKNSEKVNSFTYLAQCFGIKLSEKPSWKSWADGITAAVYAWFKACKLRHISVGYLSLWSSWRKFSKIVTHLYWNFWTC